MSKDPCLFIQKISIFLLYHIFPVCVNNHSNAYVHTKFVQVKRCTTYYSVLRY